MADGWNDMISSFKTYSSCRVKHYEHGDSEGASTPYQTTHAYIGNAMNDQTSSIKWT